VSARAAPAPDQARAGLRADRKRRGPRRALAEHLRTDRCDRVLPLRAAEGVAALG